MNDISPVAAPQLKKLESDNLGLNGPFYYNMQDGHGLRVFQVEKEMSASQYQLVEPKNTQFQKVIKSTREAPNSRQNRHSKALRVLKSVGQSQNAVKLNNFCKKGEKKLENFGIENGRIFNGGAQRTQKTGREDIFGNLRGLASSNFDFKKKKKSKVRSQNRSGLAKQGPSGERGKEEERVTVSGFVGESHNFGQKSKPKNFRQKGYQRGLERFRQAEKLYGSSQEPSEQRDREENPQNLDYLNFDQYQKTDILGPENPQKRRLEHHEDSNRHREGRESSSFYLEEAETQKNLIYHQSSQNNTESSKRLETDFIDKETTSGSFKAALNRPKSHKKLKKAEKVRKTQKQEIGFQHHYSGTGTDSSFYQTYMRRSLGALPDHEQRFQTNESVSVNELVSVIKENTELRKLTSRYNQEIEHMTEAFSKLNTKYRRVKAQKSKLNLRVENLEQLLVLYQKKDLEGARKGNGMLKRADYGKYGDFGVDGVHSPEFDSSEDEASFYQKEREGETEESITSISHKKWTLDGVDYANFAKNPSFHEQRLLASYGLKMKERLENRARRNRKRLRWGSMELNRGKNRLLGSETRTAKIGSKLYNPVHRLNKKYKRAKNRSNEVNRGAETDFNKTIKNFLKVERNSTKKSLRRNQSAIALKTASKGSRTVNQQKNLDLLKERFLGLHKASGRIDQLKLSTNSSQVKLNFNFNKKLESSKPYKKKTAYRHKNTKKKLLNVFSSHKLDQRRLSGSGVVVERGGQQVFANGKGQVVKVAGKGMGRFVGDRVAGGLIGGENVVVGSFRDGVGGVGGAGYGSFGDAGKKVNQNSMKNFLR